MLAKLKAARGCVVAALLLVAGVEKLKAATGCVVAALLLVAGVEKLKAMFYNNKI